jgi:hypothetical protein
MIDYIKLKFCFLMIKKIAFLLIAIILLTACEGILNTSGVEITIIDAANPIQVNVPEGSSVAEAIVTAGLKLNTLDKIDPALTAHLTMQTTITITRVTEEFVVEESVLQFDHQTVKNESLQEGQTVLIQSGVNGRKQSIYRVVYENGVQVSRSFVSSENLVAAQPEIVMVGVQSPYSVVSMQGLIVYISSGNAWAMEANTGNRRPVVTTGDLDGRIFTLSPDRNWLLFSRTTEEDSKTEINHLWLINLLSDSPDLIDTGITNVVHYAEWVPGKTRTITYSTAELSASPPFWNANNDLIQARFDIDGTLIDKKTIVDTNSGGLYGWWGTSYKWSPDGSQLIYMRPDSIGAVYIPDGTLEPLVQILPYQTESVWAWVPVVSWSIDGEVLYTALPKDASTNPSESTNLTALLIESRQLIPLVMDCGLFCIPSSPSTDLTGMEYVAFLNAILPDQSEVSRYNLFVMDKDGSNRIKLYPGEGIQGLQAQMVFWEPVESPKDQPRLAFVAQGNLFLADLQSNSVKQVTGDGSIVKIEWK